MPRRNLLLCFDAFGTLFSPHPSVAEQYISIARRYGLQNLSIARVQASFDKALSAQMRTHPNYGKASGMTSRMWWAHVVHDTLIPFAPRDQPSLPFHMPVNLAHKLVDRFATRDGYRIAHPSLPSLLTTLKSNPNSPFHRVVIGVITNSDDRVPGVLASLGFNVSPLRYGSPPIDTTPMNPPSECPPPHQVDFHCMSYDVGAGKPSRAIFDAAESLAAEVVSYEASVSEAGCDPAAAARDKTPLSEVLPVADSESTSWLKVYVGDEFEKDVVGSMAAGWNAVFVKRADEVKGAGDFKMRDLKECKEASVEEVFPPSSAEVPVALRAEGVDVFVRWLAR